MPRNPFYVHPGTDFGPGLMGLAQTVERVGVRKKAEEKEQRMRDEISEAIQSKDPDKIRTIAGKYPELGQSIKAIMEMKLPGGSADAYKNALFSASTDITRAPQALEEMRTQFAQDGIDPQEQAKLDDFQSLLESDPETAQANIEAEFALLADEDMWDRLKDIKEGIDPETPTTAMGAYLKQKPDATPDEIATFAQKLKTKTPKAGQQYLLSDGPTVTSFDGGRTYKAEDGKTYPMPTDAIKRAPITGEEAAMAIAKRQLGEPTAQPTPIDQRDMAEAAKSGTGPYATLKATIDAVLGGAGIDLVFGLDGFFPATQENRQALRTIKQIGKAALMNSSRGAIWEQERIDRLFPDPDKLITNPRTEAKKLKVLRETLLTEKRFNNEAIPNTVTPKELSDLRKSNTEIDRLLALIGTGEDPMPTVSNAEEYDAIPSGSQYRDPQGNVRTKR